MNYILIVDDEQDIRDIFEIVLKRNFPLDVVVAESGNKALSVIESRGKPEIIITDLKMPDGDGAFLFQKVRENKWNIPVVLCSTESGEVLKKSFPDAHGFIEKPDILVPAVEIVGSVVHKTSVPPEYVPVRMSLLLHWGVANYDLYMKLSDSRFVKVINAGEAFIQEDADRFQVKGLQHLYIVTSDVDNYLKSFQENISMLSEAEKTPAELQVVTLESLEVVERIAKSVGWTPEVLNAAKQAVGLAIKVVSAEPNLFKLLKKKMSIPGSRYSNHVSILSLLSCGFCHNLGWIGESTQMKLALAALMHDLTVEDSYYADIDLWNSVAGNANDKSPEAVKYRNHPADAANLIGSMKYVPADVDQIILQHHENREGTGFPRGLTSSRIMPMTCIFIITEDLINYIEGSENLEEKIEQFLEFGERKYNSGNFKKVFDSFRASIDCARL